MVYVKRRQPIVYRQICLPASHAVLNSFGVSGNSWSRNLQISRDSFILLSPQSKVGACSHCKRVNTRVYIATDLSVLSCGELVSKSQIRTCRCAGLDQIFLGESPRLVLVRQAFVRQSETNAPDERTETPVSVIASKLPKPQLFGCHGELRQMVLQKMSSRGAKAVSMHAVIL